MSVVYPRKWGAAFGIPILKEKVLVPRGGNECTFIYLKLKMVKRCV